MRLVAEPAPTTAEAIAVPRRAPIGLRRPRRSEAALIRGAQAGREADLEELFRRHWRPAYRAAFLIVHDHGAAEDIAQEAFVAAIRTLDRFDRRRPFAPWLARIVTNRAIDWTRARSARRESEAVTEAAAEPAEPAAKDVPDPRTYSEEIVAALATLSPEHRAVVVLRFVFEYTPGEIAAALDLPRGTVNSRLRRALDALNTYLNAEQA